MAHRASGKLDQLPWSIIQGELDSDSSPAETETPAENQSRIAPVLIMPSREVGLFATLPPQGQGPASFFGSLVAHALGASLIWFSLGYKPPMTRIVSQHLTVRQLELHAPTEAANIPYPTFHSKSAAHPGQAQQASPPPLPATHAKPGPQTLIQADLLNPATMPPRIPVPQVVIWSPTKTAAKNIVPPTPEKPTSSDVNPSLSRPNQEINLSDVNLAPSNLPSVKLQLSPGTTSPIAVHVPDAVELPPASASQQAAQPTPAAILSLSDLRMKDGTATLPAVNESAASKTQGALAPVQGQNPSAQFGNGAPNAKPGTSGPGQNSDAGAKGSSPTQAAAATKPAISQPAPGSDTADASGPPKSTRISLPHDGHFGAVIVNEAIGEQFPEAAGVFQGRLAYTANLHVGLARSWILQYSLPANAEAAAGGAISHLDAPWPYNIVRPNLEPGAIDADALMIHGFINQSGRFEDLNIVFPDSFSGAQFVLTALGQWQFRPAAQNGQPARIEILLIIPDSTE